MIELVLVRQIAVLVASIAGSYTDLRTGYIFDWVTLPLIAFGVIANIATGEITGIGIGVAVFAIGYLLYYTGKIGGGDVKLYTGIALAMPFHNGTVFILPLVAFSAISAIVFLSTYYLIKYYRKGIDFKYNKEGIMKAALFFVFIIIYFGMLFGTGIISQYYLSVFMAPLLFGVAFFAFEKGIKKEFFLKEIKTSELEEDEVLALEFVSEKEKEIIGKFRGVIGEKEKETLMKGGIKKILVYRNLPRFGVFIFAGVIISILFPNTLALVG